MQQFEMEIFRTGTHTSDSGVTAEYSEQFLDDVIKNYDPAFREAPLVIGHPNQTAPAYGWVKGLKRLGDRLVAVYEAVPQFVEAIKQGLYKKRSARFYTNYQGKGPYLAHVGFLGAAAPAVPGLADIQFATEEPSITINFSKEDQAMGIKQKIVDLFTQFMEQLKGLPDDNTTTVVVQPQQFSEADLQKKLDEAKAAGKAEGKKEAETSFSEQLKAEQGKVIEFQTDQRKKDIKDFCESLKKDGKLLPAWEKLGLISFMEQLDASETISFAEGTDKQSRLDFMKKFLTELPKTVSFKEAAASGEQEGATAGAKLEVLVQKKMQEHKDLTYSVAFAEVQKEHPQLAQEYMAEIQ